MSKDEKPFHSTPERTSRPEKSQSANKGTSIPTKTPLYQAMHSERYYRQMLIKQIQQITGRQLICFVSGEAALINRDDTLGFVDLLHNVQSGHSLDVMIHTSGGDIDAAEKLISMIRASVGDGHLRVVVPDFAKSAGTLMALGADTIVMSNTSELGPIDPQITLNDGHGNLIRHSVQSYLDAYESHSNTLSKNPSDIAARIMLGKLEPATVKLFESARDRARKFAEAQLKYGMFRKVSGNYTQIASELMNTNRWQTHGQMISASDAKDIGLLVDNLDPKSSEWQSYWTLYCLQRLVVKDRQKLFESDYASLVVDGTQ